MTKFIDKKIDEFEKKFSKNRNFAGNNSYKFVNCKIDILKNWLKQALKEAEREGMKKAYVDCTNNGGELSTEFHRFVDERIKELEQEK